MPSPFPAPRRGALLALLLAGTMALGVGACGRRGRPEPPPDPNAPAKTQPDKKKTASRGTAARDAENDAAGAPKPTFQTSPGTIASDDEDDETNVDESAAISPQPVPQGRRKSPTYVVPKEPFFLDPLL